MRRRSPRLLVLIGLVALATPPRAQTAWVNGTVTDAETGAPLPGAHVFVSGTLQGDATDAGGRFVFRADAPGSVQVTATMLGYGTASTTRLIRPGDVVGLAFRLPPVPLALREVEVVRSRDAAWERALARFRPEFLGETANAPLTEITNPEVLDLDADGDDGPLHAVARAPLVVENRALGYRVTFYDFALAIEENGRAWDGTLAFRDLCAERLCGPAVTQARERAYRGSLPHFLDALIAGMASDEGFLSERMDRPGQATRARLSVQPGRLSIRSARAPGPEARQARAGWEAEIGGALRVLYTREFDPRVDADAYQVSWLTAPGGALRLGPNGALLDAADVVRYGYWDWERVADLVPLDYRPAPPAGY
ncbi:carboxypeptidase-like regulatory domain-containing protein [Rubrivirga sp. S365]|uniref:Carboxypeptidase-like regulatory domain-containing protein n=1 Tax=Rubrivirga litoralis TaxID=3075598 RepID=A0ABU3BSL0_9BACT|nr:MULTISPECIES: carboxypeptidase-like regulatory domain-containing protein [unclassified Rubrivirga]MDT0632277.1 carboxypeptidase-like regulatory domain-containing protein [Rubrivirga sp. F394]MDT7856338.1 carboxypeptidase-like regulatory domain-containing protein [Rubrivirga sp. S365]